MSEVLAALVLAESLLQRVGAATEKERDENAVVADVVDRLQVNVNFW